MRKKRMTTVILSIILILITGAITTALTPAHTQNKDSVRIPILMYHSLLKDKARWNDYVISPDEFERDLIYLTKQGYTTVFISDIVDYVNGDGVLPSKPVMITFDDGNYNTYSYAYELIKKYGCKMIVSPIASCVQKYTDEEEISPTYGYCSWSQLKEMQNSGSVEIQNHSWDLHKSSGRIGIMQLDGETDQEYRNTVQPDIEKAQEYIRKNLTVRPQCFTYPFGAYNAESEELIKEMGFVCSLSCSEKVSEVIKGDPESLFKLGRFLRDNTHSAETILSHNI